MNDFAKPRFFIFNRPIYDGLKAVIIEGLQLNGVEVFASRFANYAKQSNVFTPTRWEELADFDAVLWGEEELALVDGLSGAPRAGQILIYADGADTLKMHLNQKVWPHLFFKRELLQSAFYFGKGAVQPLGFAVEERFWQPYRPHADRVYDFSCMLRLDSNRFRRKLNDRIERIHSRAGESIKAFVGGTGEISYGNGSPLPLPTPRYFDILQNSRISISCHGAGQHCLRLWEILAAGTLLFSQKLELYLPHPFADGENIVYFSTLRELEDKLTYYLARPKLVERIAINGMEHARKFHTSKTRGLSILEAVRAIRPPNDSPPKPPQWLRAYNNNILHYVMKHRAKLGIMLGK